VKGCFSHKNAVYRHAKIDYKGLSFIDPGGQN